ncbi:hypothetical protein J3Q64DRAFT_1666188 [Phycomyces blakesleeanus]|uniref:Glycosyltransferase 2-like domain-containing protein n=2 Tax=Phycomyces blakesleeanus TaxID=4837 RepID=A0A167L8T5_PHYB8|nr:hypothetical protein PHYBLDRAFT_149031 [Phycomyces blakesleeanus NRRL 1555(-)]OAD69849.1 hypothetical protein PHYBLDRAFT_149031 [Phycomyces blakesleeanus NRRL 1555(-)]|eukprot:XP_018287889.1 hypothetical protein PHYBLDRAFT_149031 [Phycomyces blakesleeanus NRRL 1555(-)]
MIHLLNPSEWVAPLVPLFALVILPLGPIFIPRAYLVILFVYFTVFLYTQVNHVCKFWITSRKITNTVRRSNLRRSKGTNTPSQLDIEVTGDRLHYLYAFIIPNYCEPEGLLRSTIEKIASHSSAKTNYCIILGMEESEKDHTDKARRLQDHFQGRFAHFISTHHPTNIPGESRGKGSNVAHAARHGCRELMERGVCRSKVILTVTDSDADIPELYIREVEDTLNRSDDPYRLILAPPIFFSRNCFKVPAAVRVTDITWSAMVMSNLSNSRGLSFPCSTYSLSMALAERVDYWDTDSDAVGEDMHMWLKCFFQTNGEVRTAPIYVPINLTNVQAKGYMSNINARYVQAKRHYNGVADVAYTIKSSFSVLMGKSDGGCLGSIGGNGLLEITSPSSWEDKLRVCCLILEAHMIPATSGWLMFAAVPLMQFLLFPPFHSLAFVDPAQNPLLASEFYAQLWSMVKIITLLLPFPLFATLAIYESLHRFIDRELLCKSETRRLRHLFDYTMLPVAAWLFMTLPSTLACMKRLLKREEHYVVAEKFFDDNEKIIVPVDQLI